MAAYLANENVPAEAVEAARHAGFDVAWVHELACVKWHINIDCPETIKQPSDFYVAAKSVGWRWISIAKNSSQCRNRTR